MNLKLPSAQCFGAPFMAWHPAYYAELLKRKIEKHDVNCWAAEYRMGRADPTVLVSGSASNTPGRCYLQL